MGLGQGTLSGAVPSAAPPVPQLAQRLVCEPLREAVTRLHPDLARICSYHAG